MSQHRTTVSAAASNSTSFWPSGSGIFSHSSNLLLRILIEEQDALAPNLLERIEPQLRIGEPAEMALPAARQRLIGDHGIVRVALDALGRDRRGGIDPQPSASFDPDLVPCVRIALPQDPIVRVSD